MFIFSIYSLVLFNFLIYSSIVSFTKTFWFWKYFDTNIGYRNYSNFLWKYFCTSFVSYEFCRNLKIWVLIVKSPPEVMKVNKRNDKIYHKNFYIMNWNKLIIISSKDIDSKCENIKMPISTTWQLIQNKLSIEYRYNFQYLFWKFLQTFLLYVPRLDGMSDQVIVVIPYFRPSTNGLRSEYFLENFTSLNWNQVSDPGS